MYRLILDSFAFTTSVWLLFCHNSRLQGCRFLVSMAISAETCHCGMDMRSHAYIYPLLPIQNCSLFYSSPACRREIVLVSSKQAATARLTSSLVELLPGQGDHASHMNCINQVRVLLRPSITRFCLGFRQGPLHLPEHRTSRPSSSRHDFLLLLNARGH